MIAVAIDGPAGAGKSTIAQAVARSLGFVYIDTGALYRAVGYYVLRQGVSPRDADAVTALLPGISLDLALQNGKGLVMLNGRDITDLIRTPEVSMAASDVSAIPAVRAFLFDLQRSIATQNNVVMDGRDIGTVVLPHAQIKIFLTASPEERALRRHNEMVAKGIPSDYAAVLSDLKERDYNDSHRAVAPLRPAEDAITVDTTGNTLETSIKLLTELIESRIGIPADQGGQPS